MPTFLIDERIEKHPIENNFIYISLTQIT